MRWCPEESSFFPDSEFSEVNGVLYHQPRNGEGHPAEHEPGDQPLPETAPEPPPAEYE